MDTAQIGVLMGGLALIAFTLWFFFGPRASEKAAVGASGAQEITVVVKGGYSPDRIEVKRGQKVRLNFRREESTSCTEQVILSDFGISKRLPQGQTVPVEFTPDKTGEFTFHCGMNMVRGQIIVKPDF
ncbi:MAG: cupredoxin domain-containing protein [Armatimonadetes bacterium]|nr:cupredoxin domain-containing protein [Armatimonadota bacterium]